MDKRKCATCGDMVEAAELLVYALPGIPMTIGNCRECYQMDAYPLYVVRANTECIGGLEKAAEWWHETVTFKDGRYMTVALALARV